MQTQCSHYYKDSKRCGAPAVGTLVSPSGKPVPAGTMCQAHADLIIMEYKEKLHQDWTVRK